MPSWMRVVVQPRWIALTLAVLSFAGLCFLVLAPWQLNKNDYTSVRNQQIAASVDAAPVPAAQLLGDDTDVPPEAEWRRVTITGRYQADQQVLARLRNLDGNPAYEVLAPFVADDGRTYLVDRGLVRTPTASAVPSFAPPPTGSVTIVARIRAPETTTADRGPRTEGGFVQVYAIDPRAVGPALGVDFAPGYLNLIDDQPGGLDVVPLPMLDAGPYLSYGLQWLAFGLMAPLALGYFVYAEIRRRREDRAVIEAGREPGGGASPATGPADADPPRPVSAEAARAAKLADRYGRQG